jgi:hypothetical protein
MMQALPNLSLLDYLHDADCHGLHWDCGNPNERTIAMTALVVPDAGYPEWDGRKVGLTFKNVFRCRFVGVGFVLGGDCLDSFHERLSPEFQAECARSRGAGVRMPSIGLWISFISGSSLQLVCDHVYVDVAPLGHT